MVSQHFLVFQFTLDKYGSLSHVYSLFSELLVSGKDGHLQKEDYNH